MRGTVLPPLEKVAPLLLALVAALGLWLAVRAAAQRLAGPPGFDVTISERGGRVLTHERAPYLLTPEIAPTPPPGGSLVARATFLAPETGTYTWQLGCTAPCTLRVDGQIVEQPRPGRVAAKEQSLESGLHALEVTLPNADAAGGVAFAVRPPSAPWRSPLLGPGDVVASTPAEVESRLGKNPLFLVPLLAWLPFLITLSTALILFFAIGAQRRENARAYLDRLRADATAQRLFTAALLGLVVLPMIWPLFAPGYYACHEEESYIVRLIEFDRALRNGVPLGRWWPDPVLGRGYPFLCLYAPLLYLLSTPFLLLGFSSLVTLEIVSGLAVIAGALFTFLTARRRASRPAALLAAALFAYAPYLQTDLWIRADLAETLGFACFPAALFALEVALDRRADDAPPPYAAVAGLALGLFALGSCHNITAYFSIYFLALWLLLRLAFKSVSIEGLRCLVAGVALGALMTLFFVVPALVDSHRVWVERIIGGYYDALRNFVPVDTVLTTTPRWGMRTFVGSAASLGIGAGLLALVLRRPVGDRLRARPPGVRLLALQGALGTLLALTIATAPLGRPFVLYVPLARNVAFPWRLFVFAGCLAPLCAPAALDGFFTRARMRWIVSLLAIAGVMLELAPQYGPPAPLVRSHLDTERFLRSLEIDYVTSMNEYLPRTVKRTVPRFGEVAHVIDGSAQLSALSRTPGKYEVTVDAQSPSTIEFNAHWFPGWRARSDGNELKIGPGSASFDEGGLIRVRVPPGHHDVALDYHRTPLRLFCDLLSLLGFVIVLVLLGLAARGKLLRYRRGEKV